MPELRKRLEEVRRLRAAAAPTQNQSPPPLSKLSTRWPSRVWIPAVALAVLLLSLPLVYYRGRPTPNPPLIARSEGSVAPAIQVRLLPGLIKSGAAIQNQFPAPGNRAALHLTFDLPGQRAAVEATPIIDTILSDGSRKTVWASPRPLRSTPAPGGHEIGVIIDSSVLPPGDYVAQAVSSGAGVLESYFFRVTAPR